MNLEAIKQQVATDLASLREKSPLVHNITNYVVMNNTANALLSIGASPVMAHAKEEVQDMVNIAGALVINIGTLDPEWVGAMKLAMTKAKETSTPIVFDPVGAGATPYRNEVIKELLTVAAPSIIRGNASEIMACVQASGIQTKGVDSTATSDEAIDAAKSLSKNYNCTVVVSGATDYIVNGSYILSIHNGHEWMPKVTGMGCTATAVCAAFAAIQSDMFQASTSAMACMSIAGETAAKRASGPGSLQTAFIDALYHLDARNLEVLTLK